MAVEDRRLNLVEAVLVHNIQRELALGHPAGGLTHVEASVNPRPQNCLIQIKTRIGVAAHWEKNANFAATFDSWFLNLFPRQTPFTHGGGYQTLNFIPSLATMIFGLIVGRLLRGELTITDKLKRIVIAGITGIVLGKAIELAGLCPIVKRIWTPAWAIYSGGLVTLLLAGIVALIDWRGRKR